MRVLVTGNEGLVGKAVCTSLAEHGHLSVGFDIANSLNILELGAVKDLAGSCDAIVHSAALLGHPGQTDEQIMEVNLQGTWNVLAASSATNIQRIVFLSSVDVLGVFKGERAPDFLCVKIAASASRHFLPIRNPQFCGRPHRRKGGE